MILFPKQIDVKALKARLSLFLLNQLYNLTDKSLNSISGSKELVD